MDFTSCASDSDKGSDRSLNRQTKTVKRRRLSNAVSTSEAEELESLKFCSRGKSGRPPARSKKEDFLKPARNADDGEEEIQELARTARLSRASLGFHTGVDNATLTKRVADDVELIIRVATKSKHIKGTFQKALKDAGASIKEAVEALNNKFSDEEVLRLQAENAALRHEVDQFRKEMAELRKEVMRKNNSSQVTKSSEQKQMDAQKDSPALDSQTVDKVAQSIMIQVGKMIDARIESLEQRLPPEKRLRPPLAADRQNKANDAATLTEQPLNKTGPLNEATAPKSQKGKQKNKKKVEPRSTEQTEPDPQTSGHEEKDQRWTRVEKRVKKKKEKTGANAAKLAVRKLRPPRSAAVVITLQPGALDKAITYAKVLSEAKAKIDLSGIGISAMKFRQAVTGARILELPGESGGVQADTLAQKLREVLPEEIVKVSRPMRCADLRISGLDDSVDEKEIAAAVALKGGCLIETVKIGKIQRSPRSTGSVWVSCPVAAAKKVEDGRLLVGWVSAQVRLLKQRPLRCFRCLQIGHVRPVCTAEVDRSDECYRCGKPGHKAAVCLAEPNCSLCAAAGKPANHRMGSVQCFLPAKKKVKKAGDGFMASSQPECPSTITVVTRAEEETIMSEE